MKPAFRVSPAVRPALSRLCALLLLAQGGCNFGVPITQGPGGGTEGEGLTGVLVDAGGAPVAEARLRVYAAADTTVHPAPRAVDSVFTGSGGRYRIDSLPEGTYNLEASAQHEGSRIGLFVRDVAVHAASRNRNSDTLRAAGGILLRVEATEAPLHGALCAVPASPYRAVSDAQGRCLFPEVPPGDVRIRVVRPGFEPATSGNLTVVSGTLVTGVTLSLSGTPPPDSGTVDTTRYDTVLIADQDTYVRGNPPTMPGPDFSQDENSGAAGRLNIGNTGDNSISRILLRFPAPAGVDGGDIARAVIRLSPLHWDSKFIRDEAYRIDVHRVLRDWKEGSGTVTANSAAIDGATAVDRFWGNRDGLEKWSQRLLGLNDVDAAARAEASASRMQRTWETWEFDVTGLARYWAEHPDQNHGVVLVGEEPLSTDTLPTHPYFHSRESGEADSLKPILLILRRK